MAEPSENDARPGEGDPTPGSTSAADVADAPDTAVGDGGEPAGTETAAHAPDSGDPAERGRGSPLRTVGVAFGLGILGILVLVAVSAVTAGGIYFVSALTGRQPSFAVRFVVPFALSQIVAFVGVGLAYLRWRGLDADEIVAYLGVRRPSPLEAAIALVGPFAILITAFVAASVAMLFAAEPAQNQGAQTALENPSIIPVMILAMLLVVGPCEELLFRGVIQNRARETFSAIPAILLAAAVFAPIHVVSLAGGLAAMLTTVGILFVPALIFGAVYEYTENLVVVAAMHGLYNSLLLTIGYIAITYGPEMEGAGQAGAALLGL